MVQGEPKADLDGDGRLCRGSPNRRASSRASPSHVSPSRGSAPSYALSNRPHPRSGSSRNSYTRRCACQPTSRGRKIAKVRSVIDAQEHRHECGVNRIVPAAELGARPLPTADRALISLSHQSASATPVSASADSSRSSAARKESRADAPVSSTKRLVAHRDQGRDLARHGAILRSDLSTPAFLREAQVPRRQRARKARAERPGEATGVRDAQPRLDSATKWANSPMQAACRGTQAACTSRPGEGREGHEHRRARRAEAE
jgi:hypothetical protein